MTPELPTHIALRRSLAIFAGFVAGAALSITTDGLMRWFGVFPSSRQVMSDALFMVATVYRSVYSVMAASITARLAPDYPMRHALALGVIGFIVGIVGIAATWNQMAELGPRWYPIALVILAIPCAWLGGRFAGPASPEASQPPVAGGG